MAAVNHFYAEQTTAATTTGTAWVDANCKISGSSLSYSTKYLIIARALVGSSSSSAAMAARLESIGANTDPFIDAPDTAWEMTHTTVGENKLVWFVFSDTTPSSGTLNDYGWHLRSSGGATARIDQMTLMVIDLDDLGSSNYLEDGPYDVAGDELDTVYSTQTASTNNTFAQIGSGSLTGDTEYLVLGWFRWEVGSATRSASVRLRGDRDASNTLQVMTYHYEEGEDTTWPEWRSVPLMGRVLTASSPSVGIQIEAAEEAANANADYISSYLIAIDVSALAKFDYSFSSTGATVSGSPASPTTLATISSFAPATSGNHLLVGMFNYTQGGADSRVSGQITYNGTSVLTNDIDTYQTQNWDPTDAEPIAMMARESLSATADIDLDGATHASDTDATSEYEFLAVLDLEKASGTQTIGPPALASQTATAFAPTFTLYLEPVLEQELANAYDPTKLGFGIRPALEQQLAAAFDPVKLSHSIKPDLEQRLAVAFDPTFTLYIEPALEQQLAAAYDPTFGIDVTPALEQQLAAAYDPLQITYEQFIEPALEQQLAAGFDPTFTLYVTPVLEQQLAAGFDPDLSVDVAPDLFQRLAVAFDPTFGIDVTPDLEQQLAAGFDPTFGIDVTPVLFEQTAQAYAPSFTVDIAPALYEQLAAAFDATFTLYLTPALEQQTAAGFDPSFAISIQPDLEQQLAGSYSPTFTIDVTPDLFQQLAAAYVPTFSIDVTPTLEQQLAQAFDPAQLGFGIRPALEQQTAAGFGPTVAKPWLKIEAVEVTGTYETATGILPDLEQQLAQAYTPNIGAQTITPALAQQLAATYAPAFTIDITPALTQQVAQAFDPELISGISPDLEQQLAAAYDPTVELAGAAPQNLQPALEQQLAQAFAISLAPWLKIEAIEISGTYVTGVWYITPALRQQLTQAFLPTVGPVQIQPALTQQLAQSYLPSVEPLAVAPALVQQLATGLTPTVGFGNEIRPALVQQLAVAFDADYLFQCKYSDGYAPIYCGFVQVRPPRARQLAQAYAPTLSLDVQITPDLVEQPASAFDPVRVLGAEIAPALTQQLAHVFVLTIQGGIPSQTIATTLAEQFAQAYGPHIKHVVSAGLTQQLAAAFNPDWIESSIKQSWPDLVEQFATAFDPTVTGGLFSIVPDPVTQLAQAHAPANFHRELKIGSLLQQLATAFTPADLGDGWLNEPFRLTGATPTGRLAGERSGRLVGARSGGSFGGSEAGATLSEREP